MGEQSKIEWTTHTFNPWIGCQKVSPGCDHCYAETQNAHRKWNGGTWGPHAPRKRTSEANWKLPLRWAKAARNADERPRVFCASLADVFDNQVPPEWRADLIDLIHATPELDWLERAIIVLIQAETKLSQRDIKEVLGAMRKLKGWYCR